MEAGYSDHDSELELSQDDSEEPEETEWDLGSDPGVQCN